MINHLWLKVSYGDSLTRGTLCADGGQGWGFTSKQGEPRTSVVSSGQMGLHSQNSALGRHRRSCGWGWGGNSVLDGNVDVDLPSFAVCASPSLAEFSPNLELVLNFPLFGGTG